MGFTRRAVSALAVASLLAAGTVGTVVYPGSTGFVPAASAQDVPATLNGIPEKGKLTIHKRVGMPQSPPNNGLPQTVDGREAAPGVTYSVYRVLGPSGDALDLTTAAGWTAADDVNINTFFEDGQPNSKNSLKKSFTDGDFRLGGPDTGQTDGNGDVTFGNLGAGLYLVVEEAYPTYNDGVALASAAPFLVTVPMTHPVDRDRWLDEVHVYPKNQEQTAPTKEIFDPSPTASDNPTADLSGSSLGEDIGYRVRATVPPLPDDGVRTGFTITDKLPADLDEPTAISLTVVGATDALVPDADYTVTTNLLADGSWVLMVRMTQVGLGKFGVEAINLELSFQAPVERVTKAGSMENQAWASPSDLQVDSAWDPASTGATPSPGTASNTVKSTYGEIIITKHGEDEDGKANTPLAGAEFELRRCNAEGNVVGQPIRANDTASWTTGADGTVTIPGIHLTNQIDVAGTLDTVDLWENQGTQFCLLETQAPEGYELLPEPYVLEKELGGTSVTAFQQVNVSIENVQRNAGFNLPLTGGMGIWVLLGGGVLLLLLAAAYYAATRNRKQA